MLVPGTGGSRDFALHLFICLYETGKEDLIFSHSFKESLKVDY